MSKPHNIRVIDELKFLSDLTDKQQLIQINSWQQYQDQNSKLENAINDMAKQNLQLRETLNQISSSDSIRQHSEARKLLNEALIKIRNLGELNKTSSARLGMFDDVMALFKSGRDRGGMSNSYPSVEERIDHFLSNNQ